MIRRPRVRNRRTGEIGALVGSAEAGRYALVVWDGKRLAVAEFWFDLERADQDQPGANKEARLNADCRHPRPGGTPPNSAVT